MFSEAPSRTRALIRGSLSPWARVWVPRVGLGRWRPWGCVARAFFGPHAIHSF